MNLMPQTLTRFWGAERVLRTVPTLARRVAPLLVLVGAGLLGVQPCVGGSGVFEDTGSFTIGRYEHTSTLLPSGKVLIAGANATGPGARRTELYDLTTGTWTATGDLAVECFSFQATLLPNGKVLIAGGYVWDFDVAIPFAGGELYDPASGTWAITGSLGTRRYYHTMTLLHDGRVLVAGGFGPSGRLASAELYDPASGTWTNTGSLALARTVHTATLLPNGKVLVVGGNSTGSNYLASAELYDPASGTWITTGSLATGRSDHLATLLPNGKVLVAGGNWAGPGSLSSAELYDPEDGIWTTTGSLGNARYGPTATLMPNGKVLITGGVRSGPGGAFLASAELYNHVDGTWAPTGSLGTPRISHSATLLRNGQVLVSGGYSGVGGDSTPTSAKLYIGPPAPAPISIAGSIIYCSSATSVPVPNVTFTQTGSGADSTLSDSSGIYKLSSLVSNGTYFVMPTKSALTPASPGINTMDVLAAQRHFLNIATLLGCRLTAGDVNGDAVIDTVDVIAVQRFFLGFSTAIARTGKYQFTPAYRSYPGIVSAQTGQNYDTLIFGDVASPFAQP